MPANTIVYPVLVLVLLTLITWVRLYQERIGEIRRRRIDPQRLASARGARENLEDTRAADHFRNLFEVPVLFYALCALALATGRVGTALLALLWAFAVLRCVQAFIHLGYNRVLHRFAVYVAGTAVLFLAWGVFALDLAVGA